MNRLITPTFILTLYCFLMTAYFINGSLNISNSQASSFLPEKNSTFSNSSNSEFESEPVTTIIIPNEGSYDTQDFSIINDTNYSNQSKIVTGNETQSSNSGNYVSNNNTLSEPQQRGKYLADDNGMHYYNINNCSEKKGSSGIGDLSECKDAEREMSED